MLLPMISPQDVDMIIERELTKSNESTSVTAEAASGLTHGYRANDKVTAVSAVGVNDVGLATAVKSVTGKDQQSVPLSGKVVSEGLVSDNCDRWQSPKSPSASGPKNLQTKLCETLCTDKQLYLGEEQQLCCKLDPTTDVEKSDGDRLASEHDISPSVHLVAQQKSSGSPADGRAEITLKSAATLAGLCKSRLTSDEINNNCQRDCVGSVHSEKIDGNIVVGRDAAVRKSQRCNRGRRYHELMSQGVLQHHSSRKRSESLTL